MWSEKIEYARIRVINKRMWKSYYGHYVKIIVKCM